MYFIQFFWVMTFKIEVLLGVCGFVVNICDNLAILIFNEEIKNRNSFNLCSMVNFISGCKFWSKLCKLLMLSHEYF